ncbi:MAG TPA: hypothetical protein VJU83_04630 [Burkholderiales bacterium]|nr:hypothetical protein [Burkholderiales bacterium]
MKLKFVVALALLATAVSGCIVVPHGRGHYQERSYHDGGHHHGHGGWRGHRGR